VDISVCMSLFGRVHGAAGRAGAARTQAHLRAPDALCTPCDHFAVWYRPIYGCAEYVKWAGGVLVTGEAVSRDAGRDVLRASHPVNAIKHG
jgi:hypothetical protein